MLQLRKTVAGVAGPLRAIIEQRNSDAYQLENGSLAEARQTNEERGKKALSLLLEQREPESYQIEENALLTTPLFLGEMTAITRASAHLEREENKTMTPIPTVEPEALPTPTEATRVQFRQALIEVDDPDAFWAGVVGGQIAMVEASQPLTGALVFALFEDAINDLEFSETWLAGYLLGLSDALLRQRKLYPRDYATQLKPLKEGKRRK